MRLSNIKKVIVSVSLAFGLVSGGMVAFGAQSDIVTPNQTKVVKAAGSVNSQVIEDGNTRVVIVGAGQRVPSQVITPGVATNTQIRRATFSNATVSNATVSNASSSSSSSSRGRSSGSSYGGGSARPVSTNNTNTTNNVGPNGNSYNSNTANTNTRNVGPAGANNNGATKGDVKAPKRGRLNVPKTADASAMGLYAALLGLSTVGGAFVVATKKKEN